MEIQSGGRLTGIVRRWKKRAAQVETTQESFFPPLKATRTTSSAALLASDTFPPLKPSPADKELPVDPELTPDQAAALRNIEAAFEPGGVYLLTGLDFNLTCSGANTATCQGGLQGQTVDGKFQATDVDMNKQGDPSAGYSDQFGNNYTGTFDQNNGVSFTNAATGVTSSNSRFIDGSDQTTLNGSGSLFGGTQGVFNSNCGGSCEAKGSLFDQPGHAGSVANAEKMIGKSFEDNLNFFGGHGKSTSYRTGEDQLTHVVVHAGGATEIHFEGHPPGRDLVNFVLHQVGAIRDLLNNQSSKEP